MGQNVNPQNHISEHHVGISFSWKFILSWNLAASKLLEKEDRVPPLCSPHHCLSSVAQRMLSIYHSHSSIFTLSILAVVALVQVSTCAQDCKLMFPKTIQKTPFKTCFYFKAPKTSVQSGFWAWSDL